MTLDRRQIMKDARRRYQSRQRAGDAPLSWQECVRRAWAAWRHRHQTSIEAQMDAIAAGVRAHRPLI